MENVSLGVGFTCTMQDDTKIVFNNNILAGSIRLDERNLIFC